MNQATPAAEVLGGGQPARLRIGVGLIGFGWLGQAHSRSLARLPTLFADREFDADLVICADTVPERLEEAVGAFGYAEAAADWRRVVEHPDVDVVVIAAPNMLHLELIEAAARAGKDIFCEKPVGGTPEQTERAAVAARVAGVITGVGYNYRWAPLVQYAAQLIASGRLGEITNYRGRFFSMYGSDPLGPLSWRYRLDEAGHGASTDLLSHAVDLGTMLLGPITRVVGATETFIRERPVSASATHYGRGSAGDPTGAVTNEDYASMLCEFASGARGTFEASRTIVGPESQMAFDVYGTRGALSWNLERMNELQVYLAEDVPHTGYRTVFGGERFPYHGNFVPGSANGIGFEDLVVIEDFEFLSSVAARRPHRPGFEDALAFVRVQAALLESCRSGQWEAVAA
jgi:predicted dehydrogenase